MHCSAKQALKPLTRRAAESAASTERSFFDIERKAVAVGAVFSGDSALPRIAAAAAAATFPANAAVVVMVIY